MSSESPPIRITLCFNSGRGDPKMMTGDVVFTIMATGQEHRGPAGVLGMLTYLYHIAFDAAAEIKNVVAADQHVAIEGDFIGKHVGEFAGVPATNKEVRVPLAIVYDLENDQIKCGRIYFEMPALWRQLDVPPAR
ncbi:MAG: ester cyclase [Chloroflexi bacterium]|nr:ester cyclase [Chloroflexota bacterium]